MSTIFLFFLHLVLLNVVCCFILQGSSELKPENVRERIFYKNKNGPCREKQFRCRNNNCIDKRKFCNSRDDCGDDSDENRCDTVERYESCPGYQLYIRCGLEYKKCIPKSWECDGVFDCSDGYDETSCAYFNESVVASDQLIRAKVAARNWILSQRKNENRITKWGFDIPRTAAAFYFSEMSEQNDTDYTGELAYELSTSLLSRLTLRKIEDIKTSELATYVNSFLAFCINPRNFYVVNLIEELRKRVDTQKIANPYAMLALCNAKEFITELDVEKLITAFQKANEEQRTDTQAIIIMALSCASTQPESSFDGKELSDYTMEIKKKQYRNGTVENIKTTALVLQALFASEPEPDEENFDEEKAIKQILRAQEKDGSFGGLMNTYYVIPILSMSSLVNVSGVLCPEVTADENEGLEYLKIQVGEKWNITYSIWIGDEKILRKSLTLSIPANTSFYGIMEYAAGVDDKYKFEYNVRNRKPYIFALSGMMDDPEMEMSWYPYYLFSNSSQPTLISKSPADIMPNNNEHMLFWYKRVV